MLRLGTRVVVTKGEDEGLTGVISARRGEQCHYDLNCLYEGTTLQLTDYEVKLDGIEHTLDKNGYYPDYVLLNEDEIEVIEKEEKMDDKKIFEGYSLKHQPIKFARLREDAIIPSKREEDGCADVYANFEEESIVIEPFKVKLIPTGLCSTFESKYRIGIRERGSNTKSTLFTMAGQIDSNYTGEWFVALYNANDIPVEITKLVSDVEKTDKLIKVPYSKAIAQFAIEYVPKVDFEEVDVEYIKNLKTNRGSGCLGSSGK